MIFQTDSKRLLDALTRCSGGVAVTQRAYAKIAQADGKDGFDSAKLREAATILNDRGNGDQCLSEGLEAARSWGSGTSDTALPAEVTAPSGGEITPDANAPNLDPYAADRAAEREADGGAPSRFPAGVKRYACAFEPTQSIAPLPGVGSLSYVVDEPRSCINNRTAYARTAGGGLARVMLSDRDQRLSVVSFSPDRQTFTRQDFMLNPSQYAAARQGGGDLVTIACPASSADVSTVQARLSNAHRAMRAILSGVAVSRRMTWRCAAVAGPAG